MKTTYSELSNRRTLCVYFFQKKILLSVALFHSSEQYYNSLVRLSIYGKIQLLIPYCALIR